MAKKTKERNVVGEHMREIAVRVAASKITRAKICAAQFAQNHVMMVLGPGDDD